MFHVQRKQVFVEDFPLVAAQSVEGVVAVEERVTPFAVVAPVSGVVEGTRQKKVVATGKKLFYSEFYTAVAARPTVNKSIDKTVVVAPVHQVEYGLSRQLRRYKDIVKVLNVGFQLGGAALYPERINLLFDRAETGKLRNLFILHLICSLRL
jgi:hypothetical protein